jgi:hypothetical protein
MSEYEKNIAYRESSQIVSTDEYFKARPQIDNHDRRKVFESGFERGWEASKKHYEAAPTPESITIPLAEYEQMKKDAELSQPVISVYEMRESNGKCWFNVYLQKNKEQSIFDAYQVYTTTIKGRADYEAEQLKHTLGQAPHPNILDFKTDEAIDKAMEI